MHFFSYIFSNYCELHFLSEFQIQKLVLNNIVYRNIFQPQNIVHYILLLGQAKGKYILIQFPK